METIAPCVDYVESHMNSVALGAVSDTDMLSLLGGDGGCQVDVVLYLVSQRMKPIDLEFLSRLAPLTNVIPILAQADKLSLDQVAACKAEVAGQLRRAKIRPFSFAPGPDSAATVPTVPYAISCANASDHEIMDASLLMSPDYVQPLIESELAFLVQNVFSPDGASWLRHAAARKYLEWRQASPPRQRQLCSPADSPGRRSRPTLGRPPQPGLESPSLALIRMSEPHRHDGSPPRLHVADWAADLQRSLATEQTQYEALARGERAVWLTERLSECVADGTLVAVGGQKNTPGGRRTGRRVGTKTKAHQDPLGLLQVTADLKAKGWVAIELLGSLSVIGGLAFWLSRRHWQMEPVQMADEWARFWGMDI
ncbi:hypothetical protein GGR56DRAFT_302530 [Xylariaceae sp. FL0804]|nr:hypothetical protein GGR56DRAFT_302530 [Xylariaceae sp. FL0804]